MQRTIARLRERMSQQGARTLQALRYVTKAYRQRVESSLRSVEDLSPQRTLERGYSITCGPEGKPAKAAGLSKGDALTTLLADGEISSIVT